MLLTTAITFSQNYVTQINRNVQVAERADDRFTETKPNTIDLDKTKGFVLVKVDHNSGGKSRRNLVRSFEDNFEDTPFKLIDGRFHDKPKIEGYIYITHKTISSGVNFKSTWIMRDHKNKTVFAFNTTNMGITEVLSFIGITTY